MPAGSAALRTKVFWVSSKLYLLRQPRGVSMMTWRSLSPDLATPVVLSSPFLVKGFSLVGSTRPFCFVVFFMGSLRHFECFVTGVLIGGVGLPWGGVGILCRGCGGPGLGYGRAFGAKQVQTQIPFGNDKQEKQLQEQATATANTVVHSLRSG